MTDEHLLTFQALGKPEPQGSATAFVPTDKRGQPIRRPGGSIVVNVTSDNPALKKWRKAIAKCAASAWGDRPPIADEALRVECDFFLKRPEGHWGTGRNAHLLKDSAPAKPTTIPDVDKLLRAVLDGLTDVVYRDDSLVTSAPPAKHYAVPNESHNGQGVRVTVYRCAIQSALDLPIAERTRFVVATPAEVDDAQLAIA
jgi:Holliday junction resolvase RusA-like endonuclease